MILLVFMIVLATLFSFTHLASFVVSGCYNWFSSQQVFTTNHRQFQIVSLVHINVFGSLANRRSRQAFLVPSIRKERGKEKMESGYLSTLEGVFFVKGFSIQSIKLLHEQQSSLFSTSLHSFYLQLA